MVKRNILRENLRVTYSHYKDSREKLFALHEYLTQPPLEVNQLYLAEIAGARGAKRSGRAGGAVEIAIVYCWRRKTVVDV